MKTQVASRAITILLVSMLLLISVRTPAQNAVPKNDAKATALSTFEGQIMDDHCAQMGSHDSTMKSSGLATPDLCTSYCIHFQKTPGKYVLFNTASKMTYQLDDQNQAQFFGDGRKVKVIGTYDQPTKTIHVMDIKSASES